MVTKDDLCQAAGALQLRAEQTSGIEAAIHAVHSIFSADESEAILLVDASNAFILEQTGGSQKCSASLSINCFRSDQHLLCLL